MGFSPCRLSQLEVENAHWFEQAKDGGHPAIGGHPRLGPVEEAPLVEQADTCPERSRRGAPAFDLLAAPEAPLHKAPKWGVGQIAVSQPDFEWPPAVEDQLCAWEMVA